MPISSVYRFDRVFDLTFAFALSLVAFRFFGACQLKGMG
jgi:hypothetical protein